MIWSIRSLASVSEYRRYVDLEMDLDGLEELDLIRRVNIATAEFFPRTADNLLSVAWTHVVARGRLSLAMSTNIAGVRGTEPPAVPSGYGGSGGVSGGDGTGCATRGSAAAAAGSGATSCFGGDVAVAGSAARS